MDEMEAKKDGSKELKCATSNQLDVNNGWWGWWIMCFKEHSWAGDTTNNIPNFQLKKIKPHLVHYYIF
jgi:hypothetical protein